MTKRALGITAIVSIVVIVMGMSSVVPMMPKAYAGINNFEGECPSGFGLEEITFITFPTQAIVVEERNGVVDGFVCTKTVETPRGERTIIVDNTVPFSAGPPG